MIIGPENQAKIASSSLSIVSKILDSMVYLEIAYLAETENFFAESTINKSKRYLK